ncbi:ABC transporter permease [Rhodobaculum claviforme]|uniref:ABC transporter permease n=2 Tax=Rhodobaculum claviforme TaxID=1549854 RepID=A0A934TNG4_9RHOB|nr:ABC transporter permease [Rhodobaculum claviforme]
MALALTGAVALWLGADPAAAPAPSALAWLLVATVAGGMATTGRLRLVPALTLVPLALGLGGYALVRHAAPPSGPSVWLAVAAVWLGAWMLVAWLAEIRPRAPAIQRTLGLIIPVLFGLTLLWLWEVVVQGAGVPRVILPPPSLIAARIASSAPILWVDFVQTFVKGALSGYAIGCAAALVFAVLVDRSDFLRRGLLPVGNFVAALPIIGTAPIMVMWFGFDWPSKAAVVVAMVFFPMLVNTVQGLASADRMQRDLMHTWSASYWQDLWRLRLPAAMPFIFNGLKICSTLALIGAIVAEFFGSPTRGMGFRISTEVGRLQLDMVWAEITVAAIAGSLFYGVWALLERRVTFWHPSQRRRG